jgi:3-phosphoshikimate 1-carboxyvinyltransferase
LPLGLKLELTGKVYSKPYIEMTLRLMKQFGISYSWNDHIIEVKPQNYKGISYEIESDWSGASYWFSMVALAEKAHICLMGLREDSLQGDIRITSIMEKLGVKSLFKENKVELTKIPHQSEVEENFTDCPDLAQTVAVVCAIKGVTCKMTGLESLRITGGRWEMDSNSFRHTHSSKF